MIEHIILHFIKISNHFNTTRHQQLRAQQEEGFESLQQRRWCRKLCCLFKIIKNQSPSYLFQLVPSPNIRYCSRNSENIPQLRTKHDFFKNFFFPSTIKGWNNLDPHIKKSESISNFKSNILKFIRPKTNNVYYCHNPKGIRLLTSLSIVFKTALILFASAVMKLKHLPTTYFTALPTQTKE